MWDEIAPREVQRAGPSANGLAVTATTKILAERAAWDYMKDNKVLAELINL